MGEGLYKNVRVARERGRQENIIFVYVIYGWSLMAFKILNTIAIG
jgi:hypothetical protein